jgi:hypothetical protein
MESKSKTNGDVFDGFYDDDIFDGRDIVSTAAATINVNDGTAIINGNNNNNNNNNKTSVFDEGRAEGEKEGLLAGYIDGRIIGQRNGIDYGMEIGFALGLIEAVRKKILCSSSSSSFVDSVLVSVTKLEKAISEFPVDEDEIRRRLFRSESSSDRKKSSREEYEDDDEEEAYNNDSNNSEKEIESKEEDVREILQRIRARCKVLTAKLGIPHHSLKNVMKPRLNESINNKKEGNDNGNGSISQEW